MDGAQDYYENVGHFCNRLHFIAHWLFCTSRNWRQKCIFAHFVRSFNRLLRCYRFLMIFHLLAIGAIA